MAYRIRLKKASSIRPIEDEVSIWKGIHASFDLVDRLGECARGRKPKMAGGL
jgi:hypothetical protein